MTVGPDEYREGLSFFASGITVITVSSGAEMHGMTATSFASVSLVPPLISVALEKKSRTLELVRDVQSFAVNLLGRDQEDLARTFAIKGEKPFGRIPHRVGTNGAPLLASSLGWFECSVEGIVDGGDHEVVIALVTRIEQGAGEPLVYYRRDYRSLGS
jgi:Conserved protein/domain typically associated with flavoprotein oxygenases, DIM6/NTAB family